LIAAGADLNQANGAGLTPLMAAAASNQPAVLRLLLPAGASPTATVANRTAYDLAASQSHLDAMTVLRFESPSRPE
jgi:ankyrin repeat protein